MQSAACIAQNVHSMLQNILGLLQNVLSMLKAVALMFSDDIVSWDQAHICGSIQLQHKRR